MKTRKNMLQIILEISTNIDINLKTSSNVEIPPII
jgi:hypothetical protein